MFIYLVEDPKHDVKKGWSYYDTYDSFVGVANSPEEVLTLHPELSKKNDFLINIINNDTDWLYVLEDGRIIENVDDSWVNVKEIDTLRVTLIGKYTGPETKPHVICASFNAG